MPSADPNLLPAVEKLSLTAPSFSDVLQVPTLVTAIINALHTDGIPAYGIRQFSILNRQCNTISWGSYSRVTIPVDGSLAELQTAKGKNLCQLKRLRLVLYPIDKRKFVYSQNAFYNHVLLSNVDHTCMTCVLVHDGLFGLKSESPKSNAKVSTLMAYSDMGFICMNFVPPEYSFWTTLLAACLM